MPVKPEAFEYYGSLVPRKDLTMPAATFEVDPLGDLNLAAPVRAQECAHGHAWPNAKADGSSGPCERCGKPSAIPASVTCPHGVPHFGAFGGHDCAYADARDALIPYAALAAEADEREGRLVNHWPNVEPTQRWDRAFHAHMARLVALARALGSKP